MSINNLKNQTALRELAEQIITDLHAKPIHKYTEDEISKKKFSEAKCIYCGQFGSDRKFMSYYVHNECFDYCQERTRKFIRDELGLKTKTK